jgi:hypothetical protein
MRRYATVLVLAACGSSSVIDDVSGRSPPQIAAAVQPRVGRHGSQIQIVGVNAAGDGRVSACTRTEPGDAG